MRRTGAHGAQSTYVCHSEMSIVPTVKAWRRSVKKMQRTGFLSLYCCPYDHCCLDLHCCLCDWLMSSKWLFVRLHVTLEPWPFLKPKLLAVWFGMKWCMQYGIGISMVSTIICCDSDAFETIHPSPSRCPSFPLVSKQDNGLYKSKCDQHCTFKYWTETCHMTASIWVNTLVLFLWFLGMGSKGLIFGRVKARWCLY